MNFSSLVRAEFTSTGFSRLVALKNEYSSSHTALHILLYIFRRHFTFRNSFVIRNCSVIPIFYSFNSPAFVAATLSVVLILCTTFSCFTNIHHLAGYAGKFELDYTRQPSLQTFLLGCLVNYVLSLSNADPNKAPARRKMGRKTDWLTNSVQADCSRYIIIKFRESSSLKNYPVANPAWMRGRMTLY